MQVTVKYGPSYRPRNSSVPLRIWLRLFEFDSVNDTWKSLGSLTYAPTNRKTSVPFLDLEGACELALGPLSHGWGSPGEHWFNNQPQIRRPLWRCRNPGGELPTRHWEKISEIWHIGENQKNRFTLPTPPSHEGGTAPSQGSPSWPRIAPAGECESMRSEHPAFLAVRDAAR